MDSDLDLTPTPAVPATDPGDTPAAATPENQPARLLRTLPAAAGIAALAGALLAGLACAPLPALFLVMCAGTGAGITYFVRLPLGIEERLAFGAVIGAMAAAAGGFLASLRFGFGAATLVGAVLLPSALAAVAWGIGEADVASELRAARERWSLPWRSQAHPWPLLLLIALCWPYTLKLLSQSYSLLPDGTLFTGNPGAYADWAAHLTYAGSFAYGQNFPPEFPIDPGHAFGYAWGIDFLAAELVALGTSLPQSLVMTSALVGLAFPPLLYLAGVRLLGSRLAAFAACFVFLLSGGIGFLSAAADVRQGGLSLLGHLPHLYTQDVAANVQWLNPVLAYLLPQRSILFGLSVPLITCAVLWTALHPGPGEKVRPEPFVFCGLLAGVTPVFHVYGYGTAVALAAFWAVLNRRREWIGFFVPALILGLPAVRWLAPAGGLAIHQQLGWLAATGGHHDSFAWFWIKNTSLLVPLMIAAFAWLGAGPSRIGLHLAPIWLWFIVPNVLVLQPWDWDNTKYFVFWLLFGGLLVGALVARIARTNLAGAALAALLMFSLSASGVLDLVRTLDTRASGAGFMDAHGQAMAAWARENTDPRALFLVAPDHNHPIPTLGGRRVLVGYWGWLWTYGLSDADRKIADEQLMLRGGLASASLLRGYGISYVVIGPRELAPPLSANRAWFEANAKRVYSDPEYTVYRV